MSAADNDEARVAEMCCASCGKSEVDDMQLKRCDACDLVKYCSDECQQDHRPQHAVMCKERAAELRDDVLFKQPESSYLGDCPICFLPHPIDDTSIKNAWMQSCCSKLICQGCAYANWLHHLEESLEETCPFCRHPNPKTQEEVNLNEMIRVGANDPVAMLKVGISYFNDRDYDSAFAYFTKAAELGDVMAHYNLSILYKKGKGVEKDMEMVLFLLEEAAIGGHPDARYNIGLYEEINGRTDRAVKHWIIAANLGHDESLIELKECYANGDVSKDDFAAALRSHQAAVDATKSPQREEAAEADAAGELWK